MTRAEAFEALTEIFVTNFDDDTIVLTDDTTSADIEYWDSLEQINLIMACERRFGVKFDADEISKISNVGGMVDFIVAKA